MASRSTELPLGTALEHGQPKSWQDVGRDILDFLSALSGDLSRSRWRAREHAIRQLMAAPISLVDTGLKWRNALGDHSCLNQHDSIHRHDHCRDRLALGLGLAPRVFGTGAESRRASGRRGQRQRSAGGSGGGSYEGFIDEVSCQVVRGWAWNPAQPDAAVTIELYDGDRLRAHGDADQFRPDLRDGGKGNGNHVFHEADAGRVQGRQDARGSRGDQRHEPRVEAGRGHHRVADVRAVGDVGTPMTAARPRTARLVTIAVALYVIGTLVAILLHRHLFGDAAWYLVKVLSDGQVVNLEPGLHALYRSRWFAFQFTQAPLLWASEIGVTNLTALSWIYGLTMYAHRVVSLLLCWIWLKDKRLFLFPLASLFAGSINADLYIVSETHFLLSLVWPLFVLLLAADLTPRRRVVARVDRDSDAAGLRVDAVLRTAARRRGRAARAIALAGGPRSRAVPGARGVVQPRNDLRARRERLAARRRRIAARSCPAFRMRWRAGISGSPPRSCSSRSCPSSSISGRGIGR